MRTIEDFEANLDKSGACWVWTAGTHTTGYGWLNWRGENWKAHRLAYTLYCGAIPDGDGYHGTVIMHTCDNRRCCNPNHLVAASHADNMRDMKEKGRRKGINSGEGNGRCKVGDSDIRRIMAGDKTSREWADILGVAVSTINRAKRRAGRCRAA